RLGSPNSAATLARRTRCRPPSCRPALPGTPARQSRTRARLRQSDCVRSLVLYVCAKTLEKSEPPFVKCYTTTVQVRCGRSITVPETTPLKKQLIEPCYRSRSRRLGCGSMHKKRSFLRLFSRARIRAFARGRRANVAMLYALAIIPVLGAVG